mgnify:CR=1 FL=1
MQNKLASVRVNRDNTAVALYLSDYEKTSLDAAIIVHPSEGTPARAKLKPVLSKSKAKLLQSLPPRSRHATLVRAPSTRKPISKIATQKPAAQKKVKEVYVGVRASTAFWPGWFEMGGFIGTKNSSRGEFVLFNPLAGNEGSILFGEIRGKVFENYSTEGNFALGYRGKIEEDSVIGLWGGLDYRRAVSNAKFLQIAGGLEFMAENWEFRTNFYAPMQTSKLTGVKFSSTSGSATSLSGTTVQVTETTTTNKKILSIHQVWCRYD